MNQASFFPVQVKSIRPAPFGTADLKTLAIGRDGMQYAMKRCSDHPKLPSVECFCHRLAQAAQIATSGEVVLEMPDGELAFGSRWEGSIVDPMALSLNDLARVFVDAERISAILAFDRFIDNPDRHLTNFHYRDLPGGRNLALAFDFSRAWRMCAEPFGSSAFPSYSSGPLCATEKSARYARQCSRFDQAEAEETINLLNAIPDSGIMFILDSIPDQWITPGERTAILEWWRSGARSERARLSKEWIRYV